MKTRDFFRIITFIFIFLLLNRLINNFYLPWSRATYEYEANRRTFEEIQDEITFVIVGDSHALRGFIPNKIQGGYNFSSSAESYIFSYFKLRHYLEQGSFQPNVAVIPIDLHSFSSFRLERAESQDPAFWNQYVNYLEVGRETEKFFTFLSTRLLAEFSLLGEFDSTVNALFTENIPKSSSITSGFLPSMQDFSQLPQKTRIANAKNRVEHHFSGYTYMDNTLVLYFNRLLDLLENHGVKMVFVWYPISEEYYQEAAHYTSVDTHLSLINDLLNDRTSILVLDYHDLYFDKPEYFRDSDHLNTRGAEIFTTILIQALRMEGILPLDHSGIQ